MIRKTRARAGRPAMLALGIALILAPGAAADTFKPTRLDDPAPGQCKPNDCSLREALSAANNRNGRDEVVLASGTYEMGISDDLALGIESGDFNLSSPVTVRGAGAARTKVDANGLDRVFTAAGSGRVALEELTIKGGDSGANAGHTSVGGGLTALGEKVVLDRVVIRGNAATFGGGISSIATKFTLRESTITKNEATEGGGIDLRGSTVTPVTKVRASTISLNQADSKGGGMLVDGLGGAGPQEPSLTMTNSTVAENTAADPGSNVGTREGGGIMADNGAVASLDHTTVYVNQAGHFMETGIGGGIYQHSGAVFNLGDSLIAANFVGYGNALAQDVDGSQCAGSFVGSGGNVRRTQPGTTCSITGAFIEAPDLMLGTLKNNGGPTKTVALKAGSPAIGYATSCPPRDQRGVARPANGCDSGAFERRGP